MILQFSYPCNGNPYTWISMEKDFNFFSPNILYVLQTYFYQIYIFITSTLQIYFCHIYIFITSTTNRGSCFRTMFLQLPHPYNGNHYTFIWDIYTEMELRLLHWPTVYIPVRIQQLPKQTFFPLQSAPMLIYILTSQVQLPYNSSSAEILVCPANQKPHFSASAEIKIVLEQTDIDFKDCLSRPWYVSEYIYLTWRVYRLNCIDFCIEWHLL